MRISVGYDIVHDLPAATAMLLTLRVHPSRAPDLIVADEMFTDPPVAARFYEDRFGNRVARIVAPPGRFRVSAQAIVHDSGQPDLVVPDAIQHPVEDLPEDTLVYLVGSRYCETDRLSPIAWNLFGGTPLGWARVQAICDFVHNHVMFGYQHARPTKTAWDVYHEQAGVCRDFAHLAIAFCRCMNIPARYCTGYLGDIGIPPMDAPMDFAGWFEAFLGGQWYTFDARFNTPRIGRVLMARGRDAADVAIAITFGPSTLVSFKVWSDELVDQLV